MRLSLLALVAVALAAQPLAQPRSNTEGLFLQIGAEGQGLALDPDNEPEAEAEGGGLSVRAGYGVSSLFTVYGGVAGSRIEFDDTGDDAILGAGEVGIRLNFNRREAIRPYLDVALRGVTLEDEDVDLELRGGALGLGGGIAFFLSPTVALDAGLRFGGGRFDEVAFGRATLDLRDDEIEFGEGRLTVGLTAYPFRAKRETRRSRNDRGRRGRHH